MRVWVFPMAGLGSRVLSLGPCKPAIIIAGRTILDWCLTGLSSTIETGDTVIVTTTRSFEDDWGISGLTRAALERLGLDVTFEFVALRATPPGPAASVFAAAALFRGSNETIVVNHDQFIQFSFPDPTAHWDAFVPLYVSTSEFASYAKVTDGRVVQVREKVRISHCASAGVYGFRSGEILADVLDTTLRGEPHRGGEYYVGPALNHLIDAGRAVVPTGVAVKYDLGSISGIESFQAVVSRFRDDRTR